MRYCFIILTFFISISSFGQEERHFIREGNKQYDNKQFQDAEINYRKALDHNSKSFEAGFNYGDALYKQGKFEDAASQFGKLIDGEKDNNKLAQLYFNRGNAYLKS